MIHMVKKTDAGIDIAILVVEYISKH